MTTNDEFTYDPDPDLEALLDVVNDRRVIVERLKVGYDRLSDSAPEVFAIMCKLAWPILEAHHGDLYHDAETLRRYLDIADQDGEKSLTFYYGISSWGTCPSRGAQDAARRAQNDGQVWEFIITTDERKRHFLTAVPYGVEFGSRFHRCDICDRDVAAPYEGSTPRPSDPSSRCCVVAMCGNCADHDTASLYEVQASRVEAGYYHGVYFYE